MSAHPAVPGEDASRETPATILASGTPGYYWLLLLVVFAASLALRWSLLEVRWINPDEGAHLMDGLLILGGLVPEVDYGTRQPGYVYALAGTIGLLGETLTAGRVLPMVCSLATGVVIYLLGTELTDRRVGLLSAVIYLLLPLEIFQSVVVKTEAPVTFLIVSSLYAAVAGHRRSRPGLLVASGVAAGLGYYVRETALLVPLVVAILIALSDFGRWRRVLRHAGLFCAGYAGVVLVVVALYARFLAPGPLWELTPFAFVGGALAELAGQLGPSGGARAASEIAQQAAESSQGYGEPVTLYMRYLDDALQLHLFLFLGAVLSMVVLLGRRAEPDAPREGLRRDRIALAVATSWLVALAVMYGYRYMVRGFFIDYFREFLPPLVLLAALWLGRAAPELREDRNVARLVAVLVPVGAAWYFAQAAFPAEYGLGHHATLATALLATFLVAFSRRAARGRWVFTVVFATAATWIVLSRQIWPGPFSGVAPSAVTMLVLFGIMVFRYRLLGRDVVRSTMRFGGFAVAVVALAVSLSQAALRLDLSYEAVWPPAEATRMAEVIEERTDPGDQVLSGAVIWEFLAGRRPYRLVSHPLGLKRLAPPSTRSRLAADLIDRPPAVVVMDGYTEVTYGRNVPFLDSLVQANYEPIASSDEGVRPVSVFRLADSEREASGPEER